MSDAQVPPTKNDLEPEGTEEQVHALPDAILSVLVAVAQKAGDFALGITLNVAGATVTGKLVGRDAWFTQLMETYGELEQVFGPLAERMAAETSPDDDVIWAYIHLTDARYVTGNGLVPTTGGGFWRGRLAQVSGWSIGVLED